MTRRLLGLAAVGILALTTLGTTPAQAAPSNPQAAEAKAAAAPRRADSYNRPIYLVHGFDKDGRGKNCATYFGNAASALRANGWRGSILTWGYYRADTNCTVRFNGSKDTKVKEIGRQFAWEVYNRYSRHNISVDAIGHSMGGLVIRAALTGVAKRESGFPPYLYLEDAITVATPHTGSAAARLCTSYQCRDMRPGSGFLNWLQHSPQSRFGTDWTMIGGADDNFVKKASSLGMRNAGHTVWYPAGQGMEHSSIQKKWSGAFRQQYTNYYQSGTFTNSRGAAPMVSAKNSAYWYWRW